MLQETLKRLQGKVEEDVYKGYQTVTLTRQDAITLVHLLKYLSDLQVKIDDMSEFLHRLEEMPNRTTGLEPLINDEN